MIHLDRLITVEYDQTGNMWWVNARQSIDQDWAFLGPHPDLGELLDIARDIVSEGVNEEYESRRAASYCC